MVKSLKEDNERLKEGLENILVKRRGLREEVERSEEQGLFLNNDDKNNQSKGGKEDDGAGESETSGTYSLDDYSDADVDEFKQDENDEDIPQDDADLSVHFSRVGEANTNSINSNTSISSNSSKKGFHSPSK